MSAPISRGALVTRTAPLLCIALLVLNDHVLKAAHPGLVTGKISDFAGLYFFPLFLADLGSLVFRAPRRLALAVGCVATAVVFAAVKVWSPAHTAYCVGLGALQWPFRALAAIARGATLPALARVRLVMDATDLVALVSVIAAYRTGRAALLEEDEAAASPRAEAGVTG